MFRGESPPGQKLKTTQNSCCLSCTTQKCREDKVLWSLLWMVAKSASLAVHETMVDIETIIIRFVGISLGKSNHSVGLLKGGENSISQPQYCGRTKSISHHLRNHEMTRFPCKHQQTIMSSSQLFSDPGKKGNPFLGRQF